MKPKSMRKYWTIITTMWARALIHRFTIVAYRTGELFEIVFLLILWTALFKGRDTISGYTIQEMITYVLVGNLVSIVTRNFLTDFMTKEIKDGALSIFVVKPITYLRYVLVRELGRVSLPFLISLVSQIGIMLIFARQLVIHTSFVHFALFIVMVAFAFLIEFFISFLIGATAFWIDETDGLSQTIYRLKRFLSGGYFTLSLLPALYIQISLALPFAYSFYVPTQLYLQKLTLWQGLKGIGIQIIWIALLYLCIKLVWRRGTRRYEGVGI